MLLGVLRNEASPARDIVAMNAGAAIYVSGRAESLAEGVTLAKEAVASGAAQRKLHELASFTAQFRPQD